MGRNPEQSIYAVVSGSYLNVPWAVVVGRDCRLRGLRRIGDSSFQVHGPDVFPPSLMAYFPNQCPDLGPIIRVEHAAFL